ncbi:5-formyltetrahydrofolate cyclo-ligase [Candidiatus Paracoxiella cheracis]|uniref:5-formyltetrahydrofolate cyclo-ligase n=1 Tax=Candidiatus Paracoxiella cheracis TaxID=3405120 RepID=UPI003BF5804B
MTNSTDKKHLRQLLRHQRRELPIAEKINAAEKIAQRVFSLPEFTRSQHIAFYIAHDGEVDPHLIMAYAEKNNKDAYLPALALKSEHHLEFYRYRNGDTLVINRFGIGEPDTKTQQHIVPKALDCVFLPLVAFDKNGNRIGRGAGYYDRTFAFLHEADQKNKPCLIALAYDFQKIPSIDPAEWDIPLDLIVTEEHVYRV